MSPSEQLLSVPTESQRDSPERVEVVTRGAAPPSPALFKIGGEQSLDEEDGEVDQRLLQEPQANEVKYTH